MPSKPGMSLLLLRDDMAHSLTRSLSLSLSHRIASIEGIQLVGDSHSMIVSIMSTEFNIFMVSDAMSKRGWNLNALQNPNSLHLCCTFKHVGKAEEFLANLRDSVAEVRQDPEALKEGAARIYGLAYGLPDRGIIQEIATGYLDVCLRP